MDGEIPRLSPSIAGLVNECPIKAWTKHRLLGGVKSDSTAAMDEGKLFERLLTGHGINELVVLDFDDWRTKAAQEACRDATAAGLIPVKAKDVESSLKAARIIRAKMEAHIGQSFDTMDHQVRFEWENDGCACSGVLDCLIVEESRARIFDLKKTASANPKDLERSITRYGYHIQQAAYIEAVEFFYPHLSGRVSFEFLFYETSEPYCMTPAKLDGMLRELGKDKWDKAKATWRDCLLSGYWPEYQSENNDNGVIILEGKPWDLKEMGDTSIEQLDKWF